MMHNDGRTVIKRTMEALDTESEAIRAAQQELMASEEAFLEKVANRFGARVQVSRIHDSLDFNTEMLTAAEWKIFDRMLMDWLRMPATYEALEAFVKERGYTLEMAPNFQEPTCTMLVISGPGKAGRECSYLTGNPRAQRTAFRCIAEAAQEGLPSERAIAIEKYGQKRNPIEEEGARIREYLKEEGIPKSPYLEDLKGLDSSRDVPADRNDVFRYFYGTDPGPAPKDSYTIEEVQESQKAEFLGVCLPNELEAIQTKERLGIFSIQEAHEARVRFYARGDLPGEGTNTGTGLVQYPKEELLREALKGMVEMHDYLAKKINWGASALDAQAIRMMNEAPIAARKALEA